jgi:hypothetical protein
LCEEFRAAGSDHKDERQSQQAEASHAEKFDLMKVGFTVATGVSCL